MNSCSSESARFETVKASDVHVVSPVNWPFSTSPSRHQHDGPPAEHTDQTAVRMEDNNATTHTGKHDATHLCEAGPLRKRPKRMIGVDEEFLDSNLVLRDFEKEGSAPMEEETNEMAEIRYTGGYFYDTCSEDSDEMEARFAIDEIAVELFGICLLYTSPSPRD